MTSLLDATIARQDGLITRKQALLALSQDDIGSRLGRQWRVVLPGIYLSNTLGLTFRQRLRAALLYAGPTSMIADSTALAVHQLPFVPPDPYVRVLVPAVVQRSSRDFVVIRRTIRPPSPINIHGLPTSPAYRAVCDFVARHPDYREGLAVTAAAVQLGAASLLSIVEEAARGPARGRPRLTRVTEALTAGVRSAAEEDFRQLVRRRRTVPEPLWNCLIQLPSGRKISPDALFIDAAVIHETNGRRYHAPDEAGEDRFEDMQRRSDALVAAGFTVLHNSPRRIQAEGPAVIAEVLQCCRRTAGRGLPPGVVILRAGPPGLQVDVTRHAM